jgi:hypothetical protein
MDIGEPDREVIVEPVENPVRRQEPVETPAETPEREITQT